MNSRLKSAVVAAVIGASLFSLTSCSVLKEIANSEPSTASNVLLPKPWREATVAWTEKAPVGQVVSLSQNIAYVAKREGGDEFFIYSPAGKVVANIGTPEELPEAKHIDVRETFVDGKTYLTVIQSLGHKFIATGFDEDGRQLFRNVDLSGDTKVVPTFDPLTGEKYEPSEETKNQGRTSKVVYLIDGVEVRSLFDPVSKRSFVSGPGWEKEIFSEGPRQNSLHEAGKYLCVSETSISESTYHLVDVHTGNEVNVDRALGSCHHEGNGAIDPNVMTYRPDSGTSHIVVPSLGRGWSFPANSGFQPYSFDHDGRIYGYIKTGEGYVSGAMDIAAPDTLISLKGNPRTPIAVTPSGIGVFTPNDEANITYGRGGGSISGSTVFAVKPSAP